MIRIDTATKSSDGRGVGISELVTDGSGLSFRVTEKSAPTVASADGSALASTARIRSRHAYSRKPQSGQLPADGRWEAVVTATAEAWAEGVAIDSSPAHEAAGMYRAAVNDKNLQFTYSWKALNQVHIVGERRKSPSGRELPKEVIEFGSLAKERDAALRGGMELKTRHWRVTRVSGEPESSGCRRTTPENAVETK